MSSQTRWKLLGVLIVASVILGVVGWQQYLSQRTTTSSLTASATSQTTTQRLYKWYGQLFFDYNGDGIQQLGEPALTNVAISLDGRNVTMTNSTGGYAINVTRGIHRLLPYPPKEFHYMWNSSSEVRPINPSMVYGYFIENDRRMDIGFGHGFLTLPFANGTDYSILYYVNIGNHSDIDWQGGHQTYTAVFQMGEPLPHPIPHPGIDYVMKTGTPIITAAPGVVADYWLNDPGGGAVVVVRHLGGYSAGGYYTVYSHLSEVNVKIGQILNRGDSVGKSGGGGKPFLQHLHFQVEQPPGNFPVNKYPVDPYRSLVPPLGSKESLWTKDNDPQFFS